MSGALLFAAGLFLGVAAGWILAVRLSPPPGVPFLPPLPEDALAGDTATHIAANISAEYAFEPLAWTLVERCAGRTGMPCALAMREKPGAPAAIAAVAGLDQRLLGRELPLDSPAGRAITGGVPVVSTPDERVIDIARGERRRPPDGGIAVPVGQGGHVYGAVLAFGSPPGGAGPLVDGLTEEVKKFAPVLIPAFVAAASARQAETDELTGLPNRRAMNAKLSQAAPERAVLLILDIDHFKQVNDTLGHAAGDQALKHVARIMRDVLRNRDFPARVGGEEFAVWLPGADLKTGTEVAERLRSGVAGSPFRFNGGGERIITISIGVASFPKPIRSVENLMGVADAALYQAKRAGRNRVVVSDGAAA